VRIFERCFFCPNCSKNNCEGGDWERATSMRESAGSEEALQQGCESLPCFSDCSDRLDHILFLERDVRRVADHDGKIIQAEKPWFERSDRWCQHED
jgi:hypothetical protein